MQKQVLCDCQPADEWRLLSFAGAGQEDDGAV